MQTMICSKCKQEKNVSEFYRNKSSSSGYRSQCKECQFGYKPKARKQVPDDLPTDMKWCIICESVKHKSEFSKHDSTRDRLQTHCSECQKQHAKDWYQNNKERHIASGKKWKENNKERCKKTSKNYRLSNRQHINQLKVDWRAGNALKIASYLGGCCYICKEQTEYTEIYDCHHIDPKEKDHNIAELKDWGWCEKLINELDKTILLCSNCHRKIHKGRFDEDIASGKLVLIPGKRTKLKVVNG
jgi:hypothetical protein